MAQFRFNFGAEKTYIDNASSRALELVNSNGTIKLDNLTITGNLTVDGTTTTINSTTLQVDDKNIELGTVATPSDTTADGGGITLKGATDKTILWTNSTDAWHFNQGINVTSGNVGIGTTSPESQLHICNGSAGTVDPHANAQLVLEDDDHVGINLLSSTTKDSFIAFGNGTDNDYAGIYSESSNNSLIIRAGGNSDKITICSSGEVGIGCTSPTSPLHVFGKSYLSQNTGQRTTHATVNIASNTGNAIHRDLDIYGGWSSGESHNITFVHGTTSLSNQIAQIRTTHHSPSTSIKFGNLYHSGDSTFSAMIIKSTSTTSASVGIGTESPDATLDVRQEAAATATTNLQAHTANIVGDGYGSEAQLAVMDSAVVAANIGGGINFGGRYNGTAATEWARMKSYKDSATAGQYGGGLKFMTRAHGAGMVDILTLTSAGNVGIGTTTPANKLEVHGTSGELLSVSDNLSSVLFSANDITGLPVIEAHASGNVILSQYSGKVGIGTNSPSTALEVSYDDSTWFDSVFKVTNNAYPGVYIPGKMTFISLPDGAGGNISFSGEVTGQASGKPSTMTGNGVTRHQATMGWYGDGSSTSSHFFIATAPNGTNQSVSTRLRIQANGYIGVNEVSPNAYLHVRGPSSYTTANIGEVSGLGFARFQPSATSEDSIWIHNAGNHVGFQGVSDMPTATPIPLLLNSYGGNVGIGNVGPNYTLDVTGDVNFTGNLYDSGVAITVAAQSTIIAMAVALG